MVSIRKTFEEFYRDFIYPANLPGSEIDGLDHPIDVATPGIGEVQFTVKLPISYSPPEHLLALKEFSVSNPDLGIIFI
jgi:hypothetical protein